jgi:hypothetical protein
VSVRTLESGSGVPPASGPGAWRRDLELLTRLAGMLVFYATSGARLRRAYGRCQARGEVLWLDQLGTTRHREEALLRR